jgi:hypothetical protein
MAIDVDMSAAVEELREDLINLGDDEDTLEALEDDNTWEEELADEAHGGQDIWGWLELHE